MLKVGKTPNSIYLETNNILNNRLLKLKFKGICKECLIILVDSFIFSTHKLWYLLDKGRIWMLCRAVHSVNLLRESSIYKLKC